MVPVSASPTISVSSPGPMLTLSGQSLEATVTIENVGGGSLIITDAALSGQSHAGAFSITAGDIPPVPRVSPGAKRT